MEQLLNLVRTVAPSIASAVGGPLAGMGIVLMHGKGGRPGGNIGGLAAALEAQGRTER